MASFYFIYLLFLYSIDAVALDQVKADQLRSSMACFEESFALLIDRLDASLELKSNALKDFNCLKDNIISTSACLEVLELDSGDESFKNNDNSDGYRDDAELLSLQLHQVQEELERCFLLSRKQSELLRLSALNQARCSVLLGGLLE